MSGPEDALPATVVAIDQADLESRLVEKAKKEHADEENRRDAQRLARTRKRIGEIEHTLSTIIRHLGRSGHEDQRVAEKGLKNELAQLRLDVRHIKERMRDRASGAADDEPESELPQLVRLGRATPFAKPGDAPKTDEYEENVDHQELARPGADQEEEEASGKLRDDGVLLEYEARVNRWRAQRRLAEQESTAPPRKDYTLDAERGLRIPGEIWKSLFGYQRTSLRWLWELYCQKVGGIIGDEMGLGKTVQVVAFLAALEHSQKLTRPALIVCPATVLQQWVAEFRHWWPALRVAMLHSTGAAFDRDSRASRNLDSDRDEDEDALPEDFSVSNQVARDLVDSIQESGHVLLTTYAGIKRYQQLLLLRPWGYCCLDEGHNIRNPDSVVSLTCKKVKTPYRLILSGTPIQNKLVELWSLFDFVYPGRLGTLPVFEREFDVPIQIGGYAKATNIQVQTAYKCAVVLKDMIAPYMLRRMKCDVASDLPKKTEKVLFCRLTKEQRRKYQEFVKHELEYYAAGKRNLLGGIDIVRKICNHPDLVMQDTSQPDYGDPARSGKMQVVRGLLELWKEQGHKALLFSQSRQMLDILDTFLTDLGVMYLRMDGTTPVARRQELITAFNTNPKIGVFLLTTRVGGLGVNLTGANRVIIFDPDWNPSNDVQARERAWRLGQKKDVMIYRLITAGTIEERIYERQIYKQYLSNKILKDPKQKRFFKNSDLHELLSLREEFESAEVLGAAEAGQRQVGPVAKKRKADEADDLAHVTGVSHEADFGEEEDEDEESFASRQEASLLEGIFAKAGGSLKQDAVSNVARPDTMFMQREAERIANQASATLKKSRQEAQKAKIGTPTWTGRAGIAGKKLKTSRASSQLMDNLRKQKELETRARDTRALAPSTLSKNVDILQRVHEFLEKQPNNEASSAEIVSACSLSINGTQEVLNLRQMLRKIADWVDKKWRLKEPEGAA